MTSGPRVPPGRAGRIWLRRRIATAQRGREQLDRKLRILLAQQHLRRAEAIQWQARWTDSWSLAATWLLRATVLGGQDALRNAAATEPASVTLSWATAAGVTYPADAQLREPADRAGGPPGNPAIAPAADAVRVALQAAVRAAAANEAARRIDAEIMVTRRRLRALDKRWLPRLQAALVQLDLALDQSEQDDGIRLRLAAGVRPGGDGGDRAS